MTGIARIASYAMPDARDLFPNQVPWIPVADRTLLLIHDMQQYFLNAFTADAAPLSQLISNVAALRRHCATVGIPVCYSAQTGGQSVAERGLLMDFWGPGLTVAPDHCNIVAALTPGKSDVVVKKTRYSALYRTGLLELMNREHKDQLIICGVYAHIGCLVTALDAFMNGIQPVMVIDALGDFSAADHTMALNYAIRRCAVAFSTAELTGSLLRPPESDPQGKLPC
jgi:bifunctional isochorismate lyase/aryl carrier protein